MTELEKLDAGLGQVMKKALFFDIDGTLVNFDGRMLDSTKEALKRAKQNGHKIVLCTGRSLCQIYPWLLEMNFDGIIGGSGSFVMYQDKVIYEHFIPQPTLQKIMEIMREAKAHYMGQTRNKLIVSSEHSTPEHLLKRLKDIQRGEYRQSYPPHIEVDRNMASRKDIEKITYFDAEMPFEDVKRSLLPYCEITGMSFNDLGANSGEITDKGVNKALGIQKFIEYVGLSKEDTISFGDGDNDHEMIEYTEIGVAMGNASDALKQKANYVAKHITEDGIYHTLQEFELL